MRYTRVCVCAHIYTPQHISSIIRKSNRSQPRKHEANSDIEDEDPIAGASNEPVQATEMCISTYIYICPMAQ